MTGLSHKPRRGLAALALAGALAFGVAAVAPAKMTITEIGPSLCETVGGGKFVDIPGFEGELIDRRLLNDIRWMERKYRIFITDGYSMSRVHSREGEHPLGLALDIVPNKAAGGTWGLIDRLARWAEPRQNRPRTPFRWVGYNGDAGHGRGDHLHLSWTHSETKPGTPAKLVQTLRCPAAPGGPNGGTEEDPDPPTPPSGGIGGKLELAPPVAESGGTGLGG